MDRKPQTYDEGNDSDSENEFLATTPETIALASAPADAAADKKKGGKPNKKHYYRAPELVLAEGADASLLTCDLLIVGASVAAGAFLDVVLAAPEKALTRHALGAVVHFPPPPPAPAAGKEGSKDSVAATSETAVELTSVTGAGTGGRSVVVAVVSGHLATALAGPVAHALLGGPSNAPAALAVRAKDTLVLSSLPHTAHTAPNAVRLCDAAYVQAAEAAARVEDPATRTAALKAANKQAPLQIGGGSTGGAPPLVYAVLSSAARAEAATASPVSAATALLPPTTMLTGLEAALLTTATVLRARACVAASLDNPHHYGGETLLAWQHALAHDALLAPPAALTNEAAQLRAYRHARAAADGKALELLRAQHKQLQQQAPGRGPAHQQQRDQRWAAKPIPAGIFA